MVMRERAVDKNSLMGVNDCAFQCMLFSGGGLLGCEGSPTSFFDLHGKFLPCFVTMLTLLQVEFPPTTLKPICSGCTVLIASLLPADPNHRMKMSEILKHQWCIEVSLHSG